MPRVKRPQSEMGEAPEAMAEALAEAQAEKQNGGQEVELGTPGMARAPRAPTSNTPKGQSATPHGGWHAKRSKML